MPMFFLPIMLIYANVNRILPSIYGIPRSYQWGTAKKCAWPPACTSTSQVVVIAHGLGLVLRLEDTGVSFRRDINMYIQIVYLYIV